jgi:hypothetical protein
MSRWRLLAQHLGLAAAACLLLVAAYGIGGQQPRPAWFAAAALAGGLMSLALRRLGTGIPVTRWPQRTTVTGLSTRPGDSRTIFMAVRMQHGTRDRRGFDADLRPVLAELLDSRLRRNHGIDPAADPAAARAVTGNWLWALVMTTPERPPSYDEIDRALDQLENL